MRAYLPSSADPERLASGLRRVLATGCTRLGMQHGAVVTESGELISWHTELGGADDIGELVDSADMMLLRERVLATAEVVTIGEIADEHHGDGSPAFTRSGSFLGVALLVDGRAIATLCLCSDAPRDFSDTERSVGALLGELAAEQVAVEALRAELTNKQALLAAVAEVQANFVATKDGPRAFADLLDRTLSATGNGGGVIAEVVLDSAGEPDLRILAAREPETGGTLATLTTLLRLSIAAVASGSHVEADGYLCLPVVLRGQLVGMVGLSNGVGPFRPDLVASLDPFLSTTGHLIDIWRQAEVQRQVERQVALLSRVASQMPVGVVVTDPEGRIQWANEALLSITEFGLHEIVGERPRDVLHAPGVDPVILTTINDAMVERRGFTIEQLCRTRSGGTFWAEVTAHPLYANTGTDEGYLVMMVDITERRRAEELERATERAEASTRAKSEFLAHMSHEIRTPLNAIVGFSQLLSLTQLDERQRQLVSKSERASDVLLSTISGILDFSKIEAGALVLEHSPFSLAGVVDAVHSVTGGLADRKSLALGTDIAPQVPAVVIGDLVRVQQILMNLAGNAVKFTEHGTVGISVTADSMGEGGSLVRFVVSDTGIGIPADVHDKLFESFSQADPSTTRRYGGTGLGLSISKRLVELMGGTISVTSVVGRGSSFTVTIPFEVPAQDPEHLPKEPAIGADPTALAGCRILLAEDNEFNQEIARELLERVGAVVDVAGDGAAAVEMVSAGRHYDVILMDVQMPVMDGLEATRGIRALPGLARIPIIAMTANALADDAAACSAAGMDDFEPKPIDLNRLVRTIRRWLP